MENHNVVLLISIKREASLDEIINQLKNKNTNISLFESNTNW
jgi:vacuolar-type H+-ATPase subunit H